MTAPRHAVAEHFSAYIDGAVSEDQRRAVEAHLDECRECAGEVRDLRDIQSALAGLPLIRAPRSFAVSRGVVVRPRFGWARPLAAVAATILLAFMVADVGPSVVTAAFPDIVQTPVGDLPVQAALKMEVAGATTQSAPAPPGSPPASVARAGELRDARSLPEPIVFGETRLAVLRAGQVGAVIVLAVAAIFIVRSWRRQT